MAMTDPAQRLWVLDRGEATAWTTRRNVCRFVGAVAVLRDAAVYLVFVMAPDLERASEAAVLERTVRLNLERDAFRFSTLDDALAWAEMTKHDWLGRGWTEVLGGDD